VGRHIQYVIDLRANVFSIQPLICHPHFFMKHKILWVGEASYLKTGYAIYAKEVLGRLHATGLFDITEFALYASASDERFHNIPWRAIPNLPNENNPEEIQRFRSNSGNQFGAWKFEEVCLNTLPSVVCDIRDSWMTSYQALSPFRRHYNLCWMPTCDASPQNKEWLDIFAKADNIFTYQDWSKEILLKESAGKINVLDSASPAADPAFRPYKDTPSKELLGLSGKNIIGTIMRNQRRKLFPNLFRAFRQYINTYKDTDTILYCHTSYPDMGWELGDLLLEYGLTSRVLFTYICKLCNNVFPSFFNSAMCACPKCGKVAGEFCSVQRGPDNEQLASIINCFDVYSQISNSEGFGMVLPEVASCGVPVMAVDYSAMTDVVRKLGGTPIKVLTKEMEIETGCYRAIPDEHDLIQKWHEFFSLSESAKLEKRKQVRKAYEENYSWDITAQKWRDLILHINAEAHEKSWRSPPRFRQPQQYQEYPQINNAQYARWLILHVLCDPTFVNSYIESKIIKDLNYGVTKKGLPETRFSDMSQDYSKPNYEQYNREKAYQQMLALCNKYNNWEKTRWETVK
jgi:glycosyltransferase involved in cell wall biosynthesis